MNPIIKILPLIVIAALFLSGCTDDGPAEHVNTQNVSVDGIDSIEIDYDADDIIFYESESEELTIKEYMNNDKEEYYTKLQNKGGDLKVTEGNRPMSSAFESYMEIYLPSSYKKSLSVHSTSGQIESDLEFGISQLILDTTSGRISVSDAMAENVLIRSTSGTVECDNITGAIDYEGKSGTSEFVGLSGSGSFTVSGDGDLTVGFDEVDDDLNLYTKNGNLKLVLPSAAQFEFHGTMKEGDIKTNFDEHLMVSEEAKSGEIGSNPEFTVKVESRNGDVAVKCG